MEELKRKNPWLGLESYREGEVLYGRDDDIRDLTQSVLNDTDTLLYGKSGIGKSSILNAGVIPAARRYGYLPVLVRLSHKEQHSYLLQIKNAIANAMIPIPLDELGCQIELSEDELKQRESELAQRIKKVVDCKDKEKESLYEFFHRHSFHDADGGRIKLLIIFDQFEEIFTLQEDELKKKRFFAELADFLNDIMPSYLQHEAVCLPDVQEEVDVTDSANLDDLFNELDLSIDNEIPEYITDNDIHLVFTIREDFLSEFEYYSASIPSLKQNRYGLRPINEEQAAQIILRPMPGLIDEPVAKLIIEKVTGRNDFDLDGVPEIEVDSAVLSLYLNRLYDAKTGENITSELVESKGGEIIADFYSDAISSISESTVEYLEDMLLNGQCRRDNITIFDAIHDGGATDKELDILCNKKKILRQFNYAGDLRIEYVHDILCPVVKEHKDERLLVKQQEEERQKQKEERRKLVRKNRRRLILAACLSASVVILFLLYWIMLKMPVSNVYAGFTQYNGWPTGIGPKLYDKDIKNMVVHYRLTRRGLWKSEGNPYFKVEVLNRAGEHATNILVESPIVSLAETDGSDEFSRSFAFKQLRVSSWMYVADEDGNVSRQIAYDIDNKVLYAVQYYRESGSVDDKQVQTLWMNYVDEEGKPLHLRSNGADRMRLTQRNGFLTKCVFFNETGTPQQNSRKAYGYRYEVDQEDGHQIAILPLDEYGDTIKGQALRYTRWDQYQRWTDAVCAHAEYGPNHIIYNMGNRIDSLLYDDKGHQVYRSEDLQGRQLRTFSYDIYGHPTQQNEFEVRGKKDTILIHSTVYNYRNDSDSLLEKMEYTADAAVKYLREVHQYDDYSHTIVYYRGNSPESLEKGNKIGNDFWKVVVRTELTDTTHLTIASYYGLSDGLDTELRREEKLYSNNNNLLIRKIVFDKGKRILSLEYEVEDNLVVGQHVIGLTGAIIRCPIWEEDQFCYYRKKFIRNFAGDIVASKAVNEFGEESLVTYGSQEIQISIVPGEEIKYEVDDFTNIYGTGSFKYSAKEINASHQVDYLHITDTLGTYYRCGLRDGDIILSTTAEGVKVARPLLQKATAGTQQRYEFLLCKPQQGEEGMEHYPVYYTENEMRHLQDFLNNHQE